MSNHLSGPNFMVLQTFNLLVTGIEKTSEREHWFLPVDEAWQKRIAGMLGKEVPKRNLYPNRTVPELMKNQKPLGLRNTKPDGACLPRAISLAIYGHEDNHQMLRDAVVSRMVESPLPGDSRPRDEKFLQLMEKMRERKEWMGTEEIEAFSYILQTPIFSCVQHSSNNGRGQPRYFWQRMPHQTTREDVGNDRAIYIYFANNHFQLVTKP